MYSRLPGFVLSADAFEKLQEISRYSSPVYCQVNIGVFLNFYNLISVFSLSVLLITFLRLAVEIYKKGNKIRNRKL